LRCRGAAGCGRLSGDEDAACPLLHRILTSRSAELSPEVQTALRLCMDHWQAQRLQGFG